MADWWEWLRGVHHRRIDWMFDHPVVPAAALALSAVYLGWFAVMFIRIRLQDGRWPWQKKRVSR